jgi:hypothetical protein
MIPIDIINEAKQNASEWLEMTDNPDLFVAGILANKIIKLTEQIEYLEKRIEYDRHLSKIRY